MSDNSREGTPDPSSKKKSRRKPVVVHKVAQDEQLNDSLTLNESFDDVDHLLKASNQTDGEKEETVNAKTNGAEETIEDLTEDKDDDFVIPEGTVIVNPEPVEEPKQKQYKGPEWKSTKTSRKNVSLSDINCTACTKQINPQQSGCARRHPVLKVLLCKRCYNWYTSDEITQDEDGVDNHCRWCGDGGSLMGCDFCHNAFCKKCVKRNLGRDEVSEIENDDTKWRCYVCDPKPLANLIEECTTTLEMIEKSHQAAKEQKEKGKAKPVKSSSTPKASKSDVKIRSVAKKSTSKPAQKQASVGAKNPVQALPPGSIPVQVVMGKDGRQVIVLDQPSKPLNSLGTIKNIVQNVANKIIGSAKQQTPIKGAHVVKTPQSKSTQRTPTQKPQQKGRSNVDVSKLIWDVQVDQYNVQHVLERTSGITDSLRLVLSSLKDELKKSSQCAPNVMLEKRKYVAIKLKRAMGAYQRQIKEIESIAKATQNKPALLGNKLSPSSGKGPVPVSMSRAKTSTPIKPKAGEVIELSDSSDDEKDKSVKQKATPASAAKKADKMKVRMAFITPKGTANKRKRSLSSDSPSKAEDTDESKAPGKKKRRSSAGSETITEPIVLESDKTDSDEKKDKTSKDNSEENKQIIEDDAPKEILDEETGTIKEAESEDKSDAKSEINCDVEKPSTTDDVVTDIEKFGSFNKVEQINDIEQFGKNISEEKDKSTVGSSRNKVEGAVMSSPDKDKLEVDKSKVANTDDESDTEVPMDIESKLLDGDDGEKVTSKEKDSVEKSPDKLSDKTWGEKPVMLEKRSADEQRDETNTKEDEQMETDTEKNQAASNAEISDNDEGNEADETENVSLIKAPPKTSLRTEVEISTAEEEDDEDLINQPHEDLFGSLMSEPLFNISNVDDFGVESGMDGETNGLNGSDLDSNDDVNIPNGDVISENEVDENEGVLATFSTTTKTKPDKNSDMANSPAPSGDEAGEVYAAETFARTRDDIEAQRELHRALLEEEESSEEEKRESDEGTKYDSFTVSDPHISLSAPGFDRVFL